MKSIEQISIYLQFGGFLVHKDGGSSFQTEGPFTVFSSDEMKQEVAAAIDMVVAQMRDGQRLSIEITGRD